MNFTRNPDELEHPLSKAGFEFLERGYKEYKTIVTASGGRCEIKMKRLKE